MAIDWEARAVCLSTALVDRDRTLQAQQREISALKRRVEELELKLELEKDRDSLSVARVS